MKLLEAWGLTCVGSRLEKKALNGSACRSKLDLSWTGISNCRRFANFGWTDSWTTDRRRATNHCDKGMCLRVTCKDRSIGWVWKYEQGGVQSSQTTSDVSCYHRNSSGQYKVQTADGEFKLFFSSDTSTLLIVTQSLFRHYLSRSSALLWNILFVLFWDLFS